MHTISLPVAVPWQWKHSKWQLDEDGITAQKLQKKIPWQVAQFRPSAMGWVEQKSIEDQWGVFLISLQKNSLTITLDSCSAHDLVYIYKSLQRRLVRPVWNDRCGQNDHFQYQGWCSKAFHIDSAFINAFWKFETGEISDKPFNLISRAGTIAFEVVLKV